MVIDQILKIFKDQIEAAELLSRLRVQTPKPVQFQNQSNQQQHQKQLVGVSNKPTTQSKSLTDPGKTRRHLQGEKNQLQPPKNKRCPAYSACKCIGFKLHNGAEGKEDDHHQPKKMFKLLRSPQKNWLLEHRRCTAGAGVSDVEKNNTFSLFGL